ncbi:hypothetical protein VPH35_137488 [Triticum aestivum]
MTLPLDPISSSFPPPPPAPRRPPHTASIGTASLPKRQRWLRAPPNSWPTDSLAPRSSGPAHPPCRVEHRLGGHLGLPPVRESRAAVRAGDRAAGPVVRRLMDGLHSVDDCLSPGRAIGRCYQSASNCWAMRRKRFHEGVYFQNWRKSSPTMHVAWSDELCYAECPVRVQPHSTARC